MECMKAWELMMKSSDGAINASDREKLDAHLMACKACKREFEAMSFAFNILNTHTAKAPVTLEKDVMTRLPEMESEEKKSFLPFILAPLVLMLALVFTLLFKLFKTGPLAMMDETTRFLSLLAKGFHMLGALVKYLLGSTLFIEMVLLLIIVIVGGAAVYVIKSVNKNESNAIEWRISK